MGRAVKGTAIEGIRSTHPFQDVIAGGSDEYVGAAVTDEVVVVTGAGQILDVIEDIAGSIAFLDHGGAVCKAGGERSGNPGGCVFIGDGVVAGCAVRRAVEGTAV